MRMKKSLLCIAVLAVLLLSVPGLAADIISMNFIENKSNQAFAGGEMIGPLATDSAYWNSSVDAGNIAADTMNDLIDGTGAVTTADLTWSSNNCWYNGDGVGSDEAKLAVGYLDDGGSGASFTVTSVPYAVYNAYVLFTSDNNGDYTHGTLTVNGTAVLGGGGFPAHGRVLDGTGWVECDGTVYGNYVKVTGLTGDLSVSSVRDYGRGPLTGFIIEEVNPLAAVPTYPEKEGEITPSDDLTWTQTAEAAALGTITYNVYVGTDANTLSPTYYGLTPVKTSTTAPADFFYDADPDYPNGDPVDPLVWYWRVDAIEPNTPSPIVHTGVELTFTVQPANARVDVDPANQIVPLGAATEVTVEGVNITTYQWYKDGVILDGSHPDIALYGGTEDEQTLQFTASVKTEGYYHCSVDNTLNIPDESASARILTQRLMGWWKLDGDLTDSVQEVHADAEAHDGAAPDPNFAVGKDSSCYEFDGVDVVDDLVTITDSNDFFNFYPQGYTVSAWVRSTQTSPWGAYVAKQGASPNRGFILTHNGAGEAIHTLRQSFNDLNSGKKIDDGIGADNENWHLVTGTYDGEGNGKIYVDGLLAAEATSGGTPQISDVALIFGAERADGSVPYVGRLDDVRVYSYAISAQQAADLYTTFNPGVWLCLNRPEFDISGPEDADEDGNGDPDCVVDIHDLLKVVDTWLECGIYPTCIDTVE